jgi:hypothetical protein
MRRVFDPSPHSTCLDYASLTVSMVYRPCTSSCEGEGSGSTPDAHPNAGSGQKSSCPVSRLRRFDAILQAPGGGVTSSWRTALTRQRMDRYRRPLPVHLMTDIRCIARSLSAKTFVAKPLARGLYGRCGSIGHRGRKIIGLRGEGSPPLARRIFFACGLYFAFSGKSVPFRNGTNPRPEELRDTLDFICGFGGLLRRASGVLSAARWDRHLQPLPFGNHGS